MIIFSPRKEIDIWFVWYPVKLDTGEWIWLENIKLMNVVSAEVICKQDKGFGVGDTTTDEDITSDFYQNLHR